jgi:hypothetical protein
VKVWLPNVSSDFVDEDPFFKILKDNHVEFYDDNISFDEDYEMDQQPMFY